MQSLRSFALRFTLLVGVLVALSVPAGASADPARTAASFVDSIGVNTHTYYNDTSYRNFPMVKQRLTELGVSHVRENLVADRPDQYQYLNELAAAGVKSTLILGSPDNGIDGLNDLVSTLNTKLRGSVDAVEGPNEFDLSRDPDWMAKLASYQGELYRTVKSDPASSSLPILGPSLGNTNSEATDIAGAMDYGSIHSYPNGEEPELNLSRMFTFASEMSGSKPLMATETGYHTALNYTGEHQPASEDAQATYLPRLYLEYFRRGIARTFSYELLDEFPDPAEGEAEKNFGLLHYDFSPKPAYTALKNLTTILADPGPSFAPGKLDYSFSGDTSDLHQVLLQKRDGSYWLALWREDRVWDNRARTPESPAGGTLRISLADELQDAREYAPNVSSEPLRKLSIRGGTVSLDVGPRVVILRLGSPAEDAHGLGRIQAWVSRNSVAPGGRIAVRGRLPRGASGSGVMVTVQRWDSGWRRVARGRTTASGVFRDTVAVTAKAHPGPSRFRLVSSRAKPSHPVSVRVLATTGGAAISDRRGL